MPPTAIPGLIALVVTLIASPTPAADEPADQLIVVVRHGEKPPAGLGQLTCQGLQRALRLPDDYVRPLVTIAPTAIALGMPVNTQLPFNDPGLLADTLLAPDYRDQVIYVAWEHLQIMNIAQVALRRLGSDAEVPEWTNADYDTVFAFHIRWDDPPSVRFEVKQQSYGSLPEECPAPLSH